MPQLLTCHHGHVFEVDDALTDDSVVCHRCGSVTRFHTRSNTQASTGKEKEATATPVQTAQDESRQPGSEPSLFLTLDYTTDGSGNPVDEPSPSAGSYDLSESSERSSRSAPSKPDFEPPNLPGYEILSELGRGGMGVVYRARNESLGRDVALKTLQRMSPAGLHRFKSEFRTLADIAHPNLASPYELLSDGETWCFSMEILDGVDFLEYVWSGFENHASQNQQTITPVKPADLRLTPARFERLADATRQLASGLSALHAAGILHSDIKPSNVLMTTSGRLVLLDFGLAVSLDHEHKSKRISGTPWYMSPEQAKGENLSESSDWYSVGVMLYEVLTGQLPFSGKTMEVLRKKRTQSPVDPTQLQANNPAELNQLCHRLLERDPAKRATPADVLGCFGSVEDESTSTPARSSIRQVELVGRESHMQTLRQSFDQVVAGGTLSLFVHGRSGMGKSVLIRNFLDNISKRREAVVLEGRCYEQESVPFKALDSLIDCLAIHLSALPEVDALSAMPRDRLALNKVFPVLGHIPEAPHARHPTIENAEQQELRQRAMNALRELLQRLAIREPLVLYIDDLQWGDVDSASLLADLVRPPDAPQMLLLGSYRSEDSDSSLCLKALNEAYQSGQRPHREELAVQSLTEKQARDLACQLLARDDQDGLALAQRIAEESQGWPFFVWELAQYVQNDPIAADRSLELDDVIWARVIRLPADTVKLLELIVVAARPIPVAEAYRAVDAVAQGPSLLAQLRTGNFVRTTESESDGTIVETYHDRIREVIFDRLDEEVVKSHNLQLALVAHGECGISREEIMHHIDSCTAFVEPTEACSLNKNQWQRVFDTAQFFAAADEHERAFPYALIAAEQASSQNALDVAEQQYRIAARGAADASEAIRFRVAEGLGDVLMTRARYDESGIQFELARSLANDNLTLARIDGKRGDLCFKKADMANSARHFEQALTSLGNKPPTNVLTLSASMIKESVAQLLHTYMPGRFFARRQADTESFDRDMLRARLYDGLGYPYWFTQGPVRALWTHLRHMNLAERYPPTQLLGRAYALHAVMMTAIPLAERGAAYADKSYDIHGELGDCQGQGKARSFQTFSLLTLGRFEEGVITGREAVSLLEQAGDVWEANMARLILSQPLYFLGQLEASHHEAKQAYEIGLETGDDSAVAIALYFWVPSAPHALPAGALQAEREREREDPLSKAAAVQGRGLELLLREDDPHTAAEVLDESLRVLKQTGLRNPSLFGGVTWKATALRLAAERTSETGRAAALRRARKAVKAAIKLTKKYQTCRPRALREAALMAVIDGNEQQAKRMFEQSTATAQSQNARYEAAMTQLACGQAGLKFDWPDADTLIQQGQAAIDELERFQNSAS